MYAQRLSYCPQSRNTRSNLANFRPVSENAVHNESGTNLGKFTRNTRFVLSLKPGSVKKLDESEGEHNQEKNNPAEQYHYGKKTAKVTVKGDVAETQGRHHRQCPIDACNNGKVSALRGHDYMEEVAVDDDQRNQKEGELEQRADIATRPPVLEEKKKLGGEKFHGHYDSIKTPAAVLRSSQKKVVIQHQ